MRTRLIGLAMTLVGYLSTAPGWGAPINLQDSTSFSIGLAKPSFEFLTTIFNEPSAPLELRYPEFLTTLGVSVTASDDETIRALAPLILARAFEAGETKNLPFALLKVMRASYGGSLADPATNRPYLSTAKAVLGRLGNSQSPVLAALAAQIGLAALSKGDEAEAIQYRDRARTLWLTKALKPEPILQSATIKDLDWLESHLNRTAALTYALRYSADITHAWWLRDHQKSPWFKQGPDGPQLEAWYKFKSLVAEERYQLAWEAWLEYWASKQGRDAWLSQVQKVGGVDAEHLVGGLIKDVFNAGRLAGQTKRTAEMLKEMAGLFAGEAKVYCLELASRLYRSAGLLDAAAACIGQAHDLARNLLNQGRLAATDEQRVLWYRLRVLIDQPDQNLADLRDLAQGITDLDYFDDLFDLILRRHATHRRWNTLWSIYESLGSKIEPYQKARYQVVLGRHFRLLGGQLGDRLLLARSQALLEAAFNQNESLYFQAVAAAFLHRDPAVARVLDAQAARPRSSPKARSPEEEAAYVWGQSLMLLSQYDTAMATFVAIRRSLSSPELQTLGRALSQRNQIPDSIKILDFDRSYFGHSKDQSTLRLLYPEAFGSQVRTEAKRYGIDPALFLGLFRTESFFDPAANSSAGAQGMAQFMPTTAKYVAQGMKLANFDVFQADQAIAMSAFHLADLQRTLQSWSKSLAAYNAGIGRVSGWKKELPADPFLFNELIPFDETRGYIRKIAEAALIYQWLSGAKPVDLTRVIRLFLN